MDTWLYGAAMVVAPGMLFIGALFVMEALFEILFPKRGGRSGNRGAEIRKDGKGRTAGFAIKE